MEAIFRWWWGFILSLLLQGKWLKEVLTANALLQVVHVRSYARNVLCTTAGFQTLYGVTAKPQHRIPSFLRGVFTRLDGQLKWGNAD